MNRAAMWMLLAVVAGAAAVLSFSALRDLAILCGFTPGLAWLLPVVIDAGAAAGCLVWLRTGGEYYYPSRFARSLTWTLLAASVAGNAVVHYLTAYSLTPPWWLVVAVSAVAPAVLGAVVHLAVLTAQSGTAGPQIDVDGLDDPAEGEGIGPDWWSSAGFADTPDGRAAELIEAGAGRRKLARELGLTEHEARRLLAARNGAGR
ncbi:MAG: DUF2637 domain-containing protein [Pseudonocardia sp.]